MASSHKKVIKSLEKAEQIEPEILGVVRQMMFVYGDDEEPLPACEQIVLDLVKHQVLLVTEEAYAIAQEDKVEGAYSALMGALEVWKFRIDQEVIDNFSDVYFDNRQKRMAQRVSHMNPKQYSQFTDARKATLCGSSKRGNRKAKDPFITWLGNPPLETFTDFVLAFIARETVASVTDDAATIRMMEKEMLGEYFINQGIHNPLQRRHYEQAIFRNLSFRLGGNYLFSIPGTPI